MKKIDKYFIKGISLLLISIMALGSVQASNDANRIKLDKSEKNLTAPEAANYQWFLNGNELSETGNKLPVSSSGEYSVTLTDANGNISEKSIQLKVDDNGDVIVIFTIGDSTVQNYAVGYYPRTGWGQVLQYFFDEEHIMVDNRAVGGTSSKSFYNYYWKSDGKYGQIVEELSAGDIVFIQFGINDSSSDTARYTSPYGSFQEYLRLYVEESRAQGAIPVIVPTLRRNAWNADNETVYNAYKAYPAAARDLARELNVPIIDLDKRCAELMEELGKDYVTSYWYMNLEPGEYPNYGSGNSDNVHFQKTGAIEMAKLVVDEIQNDTTNTLDTLQYYINDTYEVTVLQNDAEGGMVTRTTSYPQGLEVTLKSKINIGYVFNEWKNENSETVGTDVVYTFTMGDSDTPFTAEFEYLGLGGSDIWLEAECGEKGALWNTEEDELASNGQYVVIEPGNTSGSSVPGATGRISYTFTVTEGIYYIHARVLMPGVEDDSFYMRLDNGSWSKITWDIAIPEWEWKEMTSLELSEGEHTMEIAYREDGAQIDKFHLGSTLPSGKGLDENVGCSATALNDNDANDGFSQFVWIDDTQTIHVRFDVSVPDSGHFSIYNSVGQAVYQEVLGELNAGISTFALNVDLEPGVYVLKSKLEEHIKTQKFIIK